MSKKRIARRLSLKEKSLAVDFLNKHWGSRHPLVNNRELFNFYYLDDDMINFYVLEDEEGVCAVCGYIGASSLPDRDIWISIWCADKTKSGAGFELLSQMRTLTGARIMACNNIKPEIMPFLSFMGYHTEALCHYYRLRDRDTYNIALVKNKRILKSLPDENTKMLPLYDIERVKRVFDEDRTLKPFKDYGYIDRRYFHYPHYKYNLYALREKDREKAFALAVFRVNESDEGKVLRLVDFIGKPEYFCKLSGRIDSLMDEYGCEYCDAYTFGVDGESAGFTLRGKDDENIIPNYLNPLLRENIDYYFYTFDPDGFTMFKADGDQDRKNLE